MYKAAVDRDIVWRERYYLAWLTKGFEDDDYRIPQLMRRIVPNENFFGSPGKVAAETIRDGDTT